MGEEIYSKVQIHAEVPHQCDECGGKLYYLGAGAFECRRCAKTLYSDYGKVRKYITEHGMASIPILVRATGVEREVLEEFVRDGTLYDPYEDINKCAGCGCVLEKGRYCEECQKNIVGRLAEAIKPLSAEDPGRPRGPVNLRDTRMHYLNKN